MHDKIKELAEQAAKFSAIMALPAGESGDKLFVEKFAELIVRECCQKLENDGMVEVAMEMKEHFGVEE